MDVIAVAQELMKFRTETGNREQINKCLQYCRNLLENSGAIIEIAEFDKASPVLFIRNRRTEDFDALCLGHLDVCSADQRRKTVRARFAGHEILCRCCT